MSLKKISQMSAKSATATGKEKKGFTKEEREAMRDRIRELKTDQDNEDGESTVLAKIGQMKDSDRTMGKRLHTLIMATAPELTPRLWYGMPAYAKDGKVVCFYKNAQKFKTRYATLGFSDKANLDEGAIWPVEFALKKLGAEEEARIKELVKKAVK